MSSSLAITTSTSGISGRIAACACFSDQSFLRKFRSTLVRAPAFRAASSASLVQAAAVGAERRRDAGRCGTSRAPANTFVQSTVPGAISLIAERARS